MRNALLLGSSLAAIVWASAANAQDLTPIAPPQVPCTWNYGFVAGIATATYCGNTLANGPMVIDTHQVGNIYGQGLLVTNDGTTPANGLGPVYYDLISAVLDMNFDNTTLLQSNAISAVVNDKVPQGPAARVVSVNAGAHSFTIQGPLPAFVGVSQWVTDTTAPNTTYAGTFGWLLGNGTPAGTVIQSINVSNPLLPVITMNAAFGTTVSTGDLMKFYASAGGGSGNGVVLQENINCAISTAACWDNDGQIGNLATQHYANLVNTEWDMLNNQPDAAASGVDVTGVSEQTGVSGAFLCNQMDVALRGARWGTCFYSADGAGAIGAVIGSASAASVVNNNSMPIEFFFSDGNNAGWTYEEFATALAFEFGCNEPTGCIWGFGGQIRLSNPVGSYDEFLAEDTGRNAFIAADPNFAEVIIGNNSGGPVIVQSANFIPAGNMSMNSGTAFFQGGKEALSTTGTVMSFGFDGTLTQINIGNATPINFKSTALQVNGTSMHTGAACTHFTQGLCDAGT